MISVLQGCFQSFTDDNTIPYPSGWSAHNSGYNSNIDKKNSKFKQILNSVVESPSIYPECSNKN